MHVRKEIRRRPSRHQICQLWTLTCRMVQGCEWGSLVGVGELCLLHQGCAPERELGRAFALGKEVGMKEEEEGMGLMIDSWKRMM